MLEGLLVDLVPHSQTFDELRHKWDNSEAAFWGTAGDRPIYSRDAIRRWHEEHSAHSGPRLRVSFGIQTKDGKPIGDISMGWVIPHHRLAMLGAVIGEPEYWGGGYGTDALLLLVDYAFDWLDMRKLWLATMSPNERVQRQMVKVGFKLEARQRETFVADGQRVDNLIYGLLREEWPGRAAMIEKLGLRAKE